MFIYIESIQRAATRYILNYPEIDYEQRCTIYMYFICIHYREIADLFYIFKCIKGYYDVPWYNIVETLPNSNLRSVNVGLVSHMQLVKTEGFKRIDLPRQLRDADSLYYFKHKLLWHYDNLVNAFDTDNVCTWSGTCRCHSCLCNCGAPR